MSFSTVISPLVRFKVEGKFTAEDGSDAPFDFVLTCERLADDAEVRTFQAEVKKFEDSGNHTPLTEALLAKVKGWQGIQGADKQDEPFTAEALRGVLNRPGMAVLVYMTYLRETGAKAKNS